MGYIIASNFQQGKGTIFIKYMYTITYMYARVLVQSRGTRVYILLDETVLVNAHNCS